MAAITSFLLSLSLALVLLSFHTTALSFPAHVSDPDLVADEVTR